MMKAATHYYTEGKINIPGAQTDCFLYEEFVRAACEEVGINCKVVKGFGSDKPPRGMESDFYDALSHAFDEYCEETEEY